MSHLQAVAEHQAGSLASYEHLLQGQDVYRGQIPLTFDPAPLPHGIHLDPAAAAYSLPWHLTSGLSYPHPYPPFPIRRYPETAALEYRPTLFTDSITSQQMHQWPTMAAQMPDLRTLSPRDQPMLYSSTPQGGVPHISDMKIVLLGGRMEGKSSSGNTILGREEFGASGRTAECVKREGETAGRHITVVEAPGWWKSYTVELTPERDKREIVLSVSLCPPGPHALLLLIRVDESFTETDRRAVQEHMELLGERVWSHTIVLFTRGDWLGDTTIEQHTESGGEALQWVVEKCGNRYHVVDNMRSDGGQVTELLEKIEEMVARNRGHQFDFDAEICKALQEKKREEERRAEERKMKVQKQRQTLRSAAGGVPHISDMKIVLLGGRMEGKSSSGNTILGREEFGASGRTAECVKREGETAGRHITVVEAPGWWMNYTVEQTPERDKREIVLSVSLCPPGPHALLLLIRVDESFTETDRRAVQEHMELLGERVWSHTIVLFTWGDMLGDTTIEQHTESEGEALQWVVEKCGNRYHVVDNKKSDGGQVTELLEKIEEMVAGNRGLQFDFDRNISKKLQENKREENRRAEERKMKVQKQRQTLRSPAGGVPHISDMKIVLLGYSDAGKSSSGNTILGREEFGASGRTAECVKREGETAGRHITVVEAPGWWMNYTVEQTPERDKREIVLSVSLCPPGPHALLLLIRVDESFTETLRRGVQEHMELLGERVWSHTIVLFTWGDCLGDTTIEQHIESGGEALQWVVEKCGNRYHVVDNEKSDGGQVTELLEKIEEMVAGNNGDWKLEHPPFSIGDNAVTTNEFPIPCDLTKVTKDLFRCSVCTDMLKDPVSIPCGHSYCRQCITSYWALPNHAGHYACPQCSQTYSNCPALNTNSILAKVVQNLQQFSPIPPAHCYAGPGDVACDFCTGRKLKAVKSCLTCTASYCESHIRQHYTVAALQKHTLEEPQVQEQKLSQQHNIKIEDLKCIEGEDFLKWHEQQSTGQSPDADLGIQQGTLDQRRKMKREALPVQTIPEKRVKLKRSDSPALSCVSLKSMDPPENFRGEFTPDSRLKVERTDSPAPSCVSLKSIDLPQNFSGELTLRDSGVKLKRSDSHAPSCVSLKSMDPPGNFRGEFTPDSRLKVERTDSPAPSCVSLKSIDLPQNFSGELTPRVSGVKLKRSDSPAPSRVSLKSMDPPENFRGEFTPDSSEFIASVLTEDHFRCSVCTEVLKDPVSIPCGHSYCRQCITLYWAQPNHAGHYACPQCYGSCPALYTNSALAIVVQKLQHFSPVPPAQCYAGPGDVACDFCAGRKLRAVKSCLTCSASYCETHIQDHYKVPVLQRHKLMESAHQEQKYLNINV
ncbi:uncharacterized protein LOC143106606 isoform X2 [Alosa pseudoharengus]|uniref:uncharacterized protein LOC143106606 isoform X2 n=1 Tax=Alosa pseudoharengus TaxID=34774 RepID=UPI003F8A3171